MENQETLATLGTQGTGRRQTKHKSTKQHRKLKRWATRTLKNSKTFNGSVQHYLNPKPAPM